MPISVRYSRGASSCCLCLPWVSAVNGASGSGADRFENEGVVEEELDALLARHLETGAVQDLLDFVVGEHVQPRHPVLRMEALPDSHPEIVQRSPQRERADDFVGGQR